MSPTITSPSYSLRQDLSLNLRRSNLTRLTAQQALDVCLSLPSLVWSYRSTLPNSASLWGRWGSEPGPYAGMANTLQSEPSP